MLLLCSSESPRPTYVLKSCLRAAYGLAVSHEANNRALGNDLLIAVRDLSKKTADPDLVGTQEREHQASSRMHMWFQATRCIPITRSPSNLQAFTFCLAEIGMYERNRGFDCWCQGPKRAGRTPVLYRQWRCRYVICIFIRSSRLIRLNLAILCHVQGPHAGRAWMRSTSQRNMKRECVIQKRDEQSHF